MIIENDDLYNPEDYMDYSDYDFYDDEIREVFANDIRDFIQDVIDKFSYISEEFTSDKNLRVHFSKHCVSDDAEKRSTRRRVYYDFTDKSQYLEYEKEISDKIRNTDLIIDSFDEYETIMKYMRKLFEGNTTVTFSKMCGLSDNTGKISVSFISYSSDVTSNYSSNNTIDVCIKGRGNKTVTLYAVDANYLQNRLNNIIKNDFDSDNPPEFYFNND
jgi:hypothetical protein